MTKYLINRIIRALISVVIVVGVIMLMVYTFLDKQSVFATDPVFTKQKLNGNDGMDELFDNRNAHGTRGLCYDKVMYEAVIPYWEAEDGKLTKLVLMPIELNFDKGRSMGGWPRPKYDSGILERLAQMSKPYGTRIEIREGLGYVEV